MKGGVRQDEGKKRENRRVKYESKVKQGERGEK